MSENVEFTGNDETAEDTGASDKDLEYRLKIPWVVIPVPVRSRSPALSFFVGKPDFIGFPAFSFTQKVWLQFGYTLFRLRNLSISAAISGVCGSPS